MHALESFIITLYELLYAPQIRLKIITVVLADLEGSRKGFYW